MPQNPIESRGKLFQSLKEKGLYTKDAVNFESQFQSPESRIKLYDGLVTKGLYTKSRDEFESQFFGDLKKKIQPDSSISSAGSISGSASGSGNLASTTGSNENPVPQPPVEKDNSVVDHLELFSEGGVQTVLSSPVKLLGALDESLWNNLYKAIGKTPDYESPATRVGNKIEEFYTGKVDQDTRESLSGQVAKGLGTAAGMIMSGKPTVAASWTKAPSIGQTLKNTLLNTRAVSGGAMVAVPEYEAAKKAGVPEDELFGVLAKNYLVGQTEAIPLTNFLNRLNKVTGGTMMQRLKQIGINQGTQAVEESIQEGVQNYLTNQIAKGSYDPDRDPLWQLGQSMAVGGIVGFILPAIGPALQTASPEVKAKVADKVQELQHLNQVTEQHDLTPEKQSIIDKANSGQELTAEETDILLDKPALNVPEGDLGRPAQQEDLTPEKQAVIDKVNSGESVSQSEIDVLNDVVSNDEAPQVKQNAQPTAVNQAPEVTQEQTPKQIASAAINALVESGDVSRDGKKVTVLTAKGGKALKQIYDTLKQQTSESNTSTSSEPVQTAETISHGTSPEPATVSVQGSQPETSQPADEVQSTGSTQIDQTVPPVNKQGGDKVTFSDHVGMDQTGTVIGVGQDGRYKIKAEDGTIYNVKPENVQTGSQSLNKQLDNLESGWKSPKEGAKQIKKEGPIVTANVFPLKKIIGAGWDGFSYIWDKANDIQRKSIGSMFNKAEDYAAKKTQAGLKHKNYVVRSLSQTIRNIVGGLPYTNSELVDKRQFIGNKNYGHLRAKMMADDMYDLIDTDINSLARVHSVLDPESAKVVDEQTGKKIDGPNTGLTYSDLNASEQKLFDAIRASNDFIHEWSHDHGLISDETYDQYKGKYIARLYEDHELVPDEIKNAVKSSRAEFSMYKQRKDNDMQVLADPVYATAKRMAQILQNQAIFDYADQVSASGIAQNNEFPGSVQLGKPGDKPFYGSLTGKFVPSYIAEDFKGYFFLNEMMQKTFELFRGYDKLPIRQFMKRSKTVYSPLVQLGNLLSNVSFAFWNGINPMRFIKNVTKAKKIISEKGPVYQQLVKEGLIGTDVLTSDSTPLSQTANKGPLATAYNKFSNFAQGLYSWSDDAAKIASYLSHKDAGRSDSEAVQQTFEGFQNYATVGKLYDFASKTPVVGNPYIKFKADLGRVLKNAITQRPLTMAAYLGILTWLKDTLSEASGEDDDVKKIRERRQFIPKIQTPFGDVAMVWQVPGVGEVNFARFLTPYYVYDKGNDDNAISDVTEWLPYQWKDVDDKSLLQDLAVSSGDVFLAPYIQLAADMDFRGKSIKDPQATKFSGEVATPEERTMNAVNYIVRSQVPFFKSAQDMISAYNGEPDAYGRERNVMQAITNNIIKVQEFGSEQAKRSLTQEIQYKISEFQGLTREIAQLKSIHVKNIARMQSSSEMSSEQKVKRIKSETEKLQREIAIKLEKQVKIVKDLEEPTDLLKTVN